ncbi:hypothetical protein KC330_g505 [Hortaea werneckii]|nr:hypothetical protein KC330_g505 [Hortaea werneckii]
MTGMLFVNSATSDFKQLNRLLVYLSDWEYGSFDSFHLVTTKEPQDLNEPGEGFEYPHDVEPTHPGLDADPPNAWKGASIAEVEEYVLRVANGSVRKGVNMSIYLLWDDRGVEEHSVIVGERRFDDDSDKLTNDFDKLRCPWDCAYTMWCNLDISNMDFEDFTDQDVGRDEDGWYKYSLEDLPPDISEENEQKRRETLEKLEREGKA